MERTISIIVTPGKTDRVAFVERMTSRPFDMECFRTMFDMMMTGNRDLAAFLGLQNLFPGVAVERIEAASLCAALNTLVCLFGEVKAGGDRPTTSPPPKGHPLRRLYKDLLSAHGVMPSEIDRQDPVFLFQVLSEDCGDAPAEGNVPPILNFLSGRAARHGK